ncbi:MAG: hypothetical protein AB8B74_04725, partial [Crocinitomicaceae bacterium]
MENTLVIKCSKSMQSIFRAQKLVLSFLLMVVLFSTNQLKAEGTKEVMPTSANGVALYLGNSNSSGPFFASPTANRIRFNISDHTSENFYFGGNWYDRTSIVQRSDVYIRITNSSNATVYGPQLYATSGAGYIANYTQGAAGPNIAGSAPTGYTPLMFNPTADGDYFVEIYASSTGGASPNLGYAVGVFFDFTVANTAGIRYPGRISCQKWSFLCYNPATFAGDINYSFEGDYYAYTQDSSIVEMEFAAGFKPFGYELAMNYFGVSNVGNFTNDRKSIISPSGSPSLPSSYLTFLNLPDTLVYIPTRYAPAPVLSGEVYGCPGNYLIPYTLADAGDLAILLDLNGTPGYQSGTSDRVLEILGVSVGNGVATWDGLDGLGAVVSGGVSAGIQATLFKGRTNVPMYDAELNTNGFTVNALFPAIGSRKLYWDDSGLTNFGTCGASILTDNVTGTGVIDAILLGGLLGPQHAWDGTGASTIVPAPNSSDGSSTAITCDDFGNARTINTWFYSSDVSSSLITKVLPSCDNDNDGITDDLDVDDDNDGILDVSEHNGTDPLLDHDSDGVPNYLDPEFPGFIDSNMDGINDNFDLDLDGIINSFDFDADGDGCDDVLEAGYTDLSPVDGQVDGTGFNGDGSVSGSDGYGTINDINNNSVDDYLELVDTDFDGIEDACDDSLNDLDGDGVADVVDLDDDNDGIPDTEEIDCINGFIALNSQGYTLNSDFNSSSTSSGSIAALGEYSNVAAPTPTNFDFSYSVSGSAQWVDGVELKNNASLGPDGRYINVQPNNTDLPNGDVAVYEITFNNPINNLAFKIGGLDNSDGVKIEPFLGTTALSTNPSNIQNINIPAGSFSLIGNTVVSTNGGANAPSNSIGVNFPGTVDRILVTTGKTNGDANTITLQFYEFSYCLDLDSDLDGVPNSRDLDSDNDGIMDVVEAGGTDPDGDGIIGTGIITDTDGDGLSNITDTDDNTTVLPGDGPGTALAIPNTDGVAGPDYLDIDADNDGIPDNIEGQPTVGYVAPSGNDTDMDGVDDSYDDDNGGTAILPTNTDLADNPDYIDLDSDNDGESDLLEGHDINGNGVIDGAELSPSGTDADMDGLDDAFDTVPLSAVTAYTNSGNGAASPLTDGDLADADNPSIGDLDYREFDSDGDGVNNNIDPDDDNDGILDVDEDANLDGDGNPLTNPTDADGDGIPDYLDLDSDNDGIPDVTEAGGDDPDGDGIIGTGVPTDTDGDGIPDLTDPDDNTTPAPNDGPGTVLPNTDTDGDGLPDSQDLDSDNDGTPDITEAGGVDTDNDGLVDNPADIDNDGLADIVDPTTPVTPGTPLPNPDTDNDGIDDVDDLDSDNDGIPDVTENGGSDPDNDGIVGDASVPADNLDTDGDGILDPVDSEDNTTPASDPGTGTSLPNTDTDLDGIPNAQ